MQETEDGLELSFATNVMAYQLLIRGLLPLLEQSSGRIVNIASHYAGGLRVDDLNWTKRAYDPAAAYRQTKQANRMLSWKLSRVLKAEKSKVTVNACHPGVLATGLLNDLGFGHGAAPANGARTPVFLATDASVAGISGSFWDNKRDVGCSLISREVECDQLWDTVQGYIKVDIS
jgi:NAD(P)-dependent dehydrogenase (short-subunit alcohol dehydrogenase family)